MDHPARTGLIGAAFAIGRSFQPNLLTRGSVDQAIITGATSAGAYGVFSTGDSFISAIASRLSRQEHPTAPARLAVAGVVGAAGAGLFSAVRWREHESNRRSLLRLAGQTLAVGSTMSMASTLTGRHSQGRRAALAVAAGTGLASWLITQPWRAAPGSLLDEQLPGSLKRADEHFFEDSVREVKPLEAVGIATAVSAITYGLARLESGLTGVSSRAAAVIVGGEPADHRLLGRMTATAISATVAYIAIARVSEMLSKGGGSIEPGHATPPTSPMITGSAASGLPWDKQTREGARWLSMTLEPDSIASIMGVETAAQPIRVYGSLDIAETDAARAQVLLDEIDRTQALQRKYFALFSPTGSGYVNYVANETFEYLTLGDCAAAAIQYSVLPSALSLGDVGTGTAQTRMVVDGIVKRLLDIPAEQRPKFFLFGESLGSQVSEDMFRGTWIYGPRGAGIDAALWIGTPSATEWRKQLWGNHSIAAAPNPGPGSIYLPRTVADWRALSEAERAEVDFLLLQNGDDPIPKFGTQVLWRRPDWLGPVRPIGSPRTTQWVPGTTFLMTFLDMLNALTPTPGIFAEGGHDYRDVLPDAMRYTWRLPATPEQIARVNLALRQRELAWELHRDRAAALAKPEADQPEALHKVLDTASKYVGHRVDADELDRIITQGLQPTAASITQSA
ncbi:MAG: alpha/beta-hydrolase family protein [Candidatus Nanopelagicales bacterium]